jgi:hypothetical protein
MMMVVVPMMTVIPIAAANPEDAIDGTDRAADTGANRAANDSAHRACRAATLARAVMSTALHAADDALRMAGMRYREQRESECCSCKREPEGQTGRERRCCRLHLVHLHSLDKPVMSPTGWTWQTPMKPKGCATLGNSTTGGLQ